MNSEYVYFLQSLVGTNNQGNDVGKVERRELDETDRKRHVSQFDLIKRDSLFIVRPKVSYRHVINVASNTHTHTIISK